MAFPGFDFGGMLRNLQSAIANPQVQQKAQSLGSLLQGSMQRASVQAAQSTGVVRGPWTARPNAGGGQFQSFGQDPNSIIAGLRTGVSAANKALAAKSVECENLKKQLQATQVQLTSSRNQYAGIQKQLGGYQVQIANLSRQLQGLKTEEEIAEAEVPEDELSAEDLDAEVEGSRLGWQTSGRYRY